MDCGGSFSQSYYFKERTNDDAFEAFRSRTIPEVLYEHSQTQPNREAFVFANTDGSREAVTYKDLWDKVYRLAKSFQSLGVRETEFIAISMRSCPEWIYATFGAILAGARPISLSLTYTDGSDIVAMMEKLDTCAAFVLDPGVDGANWRIVNKIVDNYDKTGKVTSARMPYLRYLICHDRPQTDRGALSLTEMMSWDNSSVDLPNLHADDIALLLQTSGSTGIPKAVCHTHRSLIAGSIYFNEKMSGRDDIIYNDRPFTWIGGFPVSVITGETRVLWSGFCDPPKDAVGFMVDVIKKEKCKSLTILPPRLNELIHRQDEVGTDWPIQKIGTGGQPIDKDFTRCIGKLCKRFVCGYGSTEAIFSCGLFVDNENDFLNYAIGYPNPGIEKKIVNEDEDIVPTNQRGEICIKSEALFKNYFNDPVKTRACMTTDGWYRTGDVGFMSEHGVFYCEGRTADEIISGGVNVPPAILEALIETFDGVSRVVCVPVPHEAMFQVICACVIKEKGSDVTEEKLRQYCAGIHNDKPGLFTVLPTYYMFLTSFPETYNGKLSRKDLARQARERFTSSK